MATMNEAQHIFELCLPVWRKGFRSDGALIVFFLKLFVSIIIAGNGIINGQARKR